MDTIYLEYDFKIQPIFPGNEILIAELGVVGFESFVENDEGVKAYIQKQEATQSIDTIQILQNDTFKISYSIKEIKKQNWNALWEQNFKPIVVDNLCTVRAKFHETPLTPYDIIITPKMSFGTGHHETTYMMLELMLKNNFKNQRVLDMGCGTGVLAILAEKLGASKIDAVDIDSWCYENTLENTSHNKCKKIQAYNSDATIIKNKTYDIILANINKNILLNDIPLYVRSLNKNGVLLLSGFYQNDMSDIVEKCKSYSLKFTENVEKKDWVALKFINLL